MKRTTLALAGALTLLGAGASLAQSPPSPQQPQAGQPEGPGMRMMRQGPGGPGMRMRQPDPARMAEMTARRAEHLRTVLQLRPDQEPALKAFVEAQRPPIPPQRPQPGAQNQTTPQRLDQARARLAERIAQLDARIAATKKFYAALSPGQQKAFDALPHARMGRGMMRQRMQMGGRGPDGPPLGGRMGPGGMQGAPQTR